jgi:hypothetical protein
MSSVRRAVNNTVQVVDMQTPVSTATLGIEVGTFDARSYAHGSRFLACFAVGAMVEGTLTASVVDCDTSGGTYTPVARTYGSLATFTTSNDEVVQVQAFDVDPARPFIKLKLVETVSVTTAVPIHLYIVVIPPAMV